MYVWIWYETKTNEVNGHMYWNEERNNDFGRENCRGGSQLRNKGYDGCGWRNDAVALSQSPPDSKYCASIASPEPWIDIFRLKPYFPCQHIADKWDRPATFLDAFGVCPPIAQRTTSTGRCLQDQIASRPGDIGYQQLPHQS